MAEQKQEKKPSEGKNLRNIIIFLIILVILLVIILGAVIFKTQVTDIWHKVRGDVFEYHNITFTKGSLGNLTVYATPLAIYRQRENRTFYWTLYLRNDPRVLDKNIEANVTSKLQKKVYISFEEEPLKCEGVILGAYKLGEFIDALGLAKEGAFASQEQANNSSYNNSDKVKNCSDARQGQSVILFRQSPSNESYIHQEDYCYVLEVANCQTTETSERLILALLDTMKKISATQENNATNITNITNYSNSS
jgi:hypothetical protein